MWCSPSLRDWTPPREKAQADDETGEISALDVLAPHGAIPEGFVEQLRAL